MGANIDDIKEKEMFKMEEGINICSYQSNTSSTTFCSSPSVIVVVAQKVSSLKMSLSNQRAIVPTHVYHIYNVKS